MNEPGAKSTAGGHHFMSSAPKNGQAIKLNGAICSLCTSLKLTAASAAEAELRAPFPNAQEAKKMQFILQEMGHPQPPTPIHCDNATATGTSNGTVKQQRSRAMEMRHFWVFDQVLQKQTCIAWHPGAENLGDHVAKQHPPKHHTEVRPTCLHKKNSPRHLQCALAPNVV